MEVVVTVVDMEDTIPIMATTGTTPWAEATWAPVPTPESATEPTDPTETTCRVTWATVVTEDTEATWATEAMEVS